MEYQSKQSSQSRSIIQEEGSKEGDDESEYQLPKSKKSLVPFKMNQADAAEKRNSFTSEEDGLKTDEEMQLMKAETLIPQKEEK